MAKVRALNFVLLIIAIIFGKINVNKQTINCYTIFLIIVCFILDSLDENVLLQNYKFFFHCCNSILKSAVNVAFVILFSILVQEKYFTLSPSVSSSDSGDPKSAWSFSKPNSKLWEEQLSHWFKAHFLMLRSYANFSTKSWGFVGSGPSNFLFRPLASKTQFSQMSHKQGPCGMFLL